MCMFIFRPKARQPGAARCQFQAVLMSGSGSTIFCLGDPSGGSQDFEAELWRTSDFEGATPTQEWKVDHLPVICPKLFRGEVGQPPPKKW